MLIQISVKKTLQPHVFFFTNNTLLNAKMHQAIGFTLETSPEAAVPICGSFLVGGGSGGGENPSVYSC